MAKDYYSILGVSRDATPDQLKQAYRKLAMKWHPDRHSDPNQKTDAEDRFKEISRAYDVLSDPAKRKKYDLYGTDEPEAASNHHHNTEAYADLGSMFGSFFGNGDHSFSSHNGGGYSHTVEPRKEFYVELQVTLEDLFVGSKKRLKVGRARWHGVNRVDETTVLDVQLKPGWKDGTKITFSGEGDQSSPYGEPGDLVFLIKTLKHSHYAREDYHLRYTHKISLKDCFAGVKFPIDTLDGRRILITANSVITPKTVITVRGEGMPNQKTLARGNLLVDFDIEFPTELSLLNRSNILRALSLDL